MNEATMTGQVRWEGISCGAFRYLGRFSAELDHHHAPASLKTKSQFCQDGCWASAWIT